MACIQKRILTPRQRLARLRRTVKELKGVLVFEQDMEQVGLQIDLLRVLQARILLLSEVKI